MGFEPLGKSIKSLIGAHNTFSIPRFQRDFSWDRQNYDEFYNDIIRQLTVTEDGFEVSKYFMGNMILLGDKNAEVVEVIDGQQRLTTITVMLASIRDRLFDLDSEKAKNIGDTIQNEYIIKKIDGETYRRLEPKTSFPYFANTIQDSEENEQTPSSDEENDLMETYERILGNLSFEKLQKALKEHSNKEIKKHQYVDVLKSIRDQILTCEIVAVYVDDKDQANKIFENINSKGKPLSQVDLIKNYIFSLIPVSKANVDNIQHKWLEMKKKLSALGDESSNQSITFDVFFVDYIKAMYPTIKVNSKNLYEKFRNEFSTEAKVKSFVQNITTDIDMYIKVVNPVLDDYRRQEKKPIFYSLQAISRFKGRQVRIPLLSLFIKEKHNPWVKNKDVIALLDFLSVFHFAVFGTGMKFSSNQLTLPFNRFSISVMEATNNRELKEAIQMLKSSILSLISRDSFVEHFVELSFSKSKAKNKGYSEFPTTFALNKIENHLAGRKINHDDSSIEHILDESDTGQIGIGNLIVLERNLNKKLGDEKVKLDSILPYERKREVYRQSKFKSVSGFIEEYDHFDEECIEDRAKKMAEFFYDSFLINEET